MDIKKLSKDEDKIVFILSKSDPIFANTIRRLMIEEVPTLAIEEVTFVDNSSALYDEIIANRLGLVVLKTDLKTYTVPEECTCKGKGCAKCQVKFKLKKEGPDMVYASDLKFGDKEIKPIYPKTPIVELSKKQSLELEGTAVLGKGKVNSKWSPGLVYYRYFPEINVNNKCNACNKCVEQCPEKILKLSGKTVKVEDLMKCTLCLACVESCKEKAIEVKGRDDEFIFYLEAWGQLKPKDMILEAVDIFDKKLKEFVDKLK